MSRLSECHKQHAKDMQVQGNNKAKKGQWTTFVLYASLQNGTGTYVSFYNEGQFIRRPIRSFQFPSYL